MTSRLPRGVLAAAMAPKRRRREGAVGGKKGALEGVSVLRIKYSAGRREIIGFLEASRRSLSRVIDSLGNFEKL